MPNRTLAMVMYISRSAPTTSRPDVEKVVAAARRNNELRRVTGAMMWTGRYFVQVLEGELPAVIATHKLITQDTRHHAMKVLFQGELESRNFSRWSMAFVDRPDADHLIEPLIEGIQDAESFRALRRMLFDLAMSQDPGGDRH
ncbi:BLUF domain-containing protein [Xylophilus sp. GOD-11R]|uniref:BLUF domain-containing protein n=1 Tax=Xylophilus sp. GOD-11R TaxID=3089814 RepID=UPI00298C613D|nr:BLUF domain-containing protein [Xylophilus sp. GOD-11R]WPB55185.1 BLUF domain-containing protein [Xylophilus sp. GOD-11R]